MTILTKNTDKLREEVAAIAVTFRALCAELTAWAEKTSAHYFQPPDVLLRAGAAQGEADEPAVPQGREPAAVTGRPSDEELLDLLPQGNESGFWLPKGLPSDWVDGEFIAPPKAIIAFARDVLELWGNPTPQPPADGEVAELVAWLRSNALTVKKASGNPANGARQRMNRAAELLQRQALVPVPVSERPWEREGWCDELGRCWWGRPDKGDWSADWTLATPEAIDEFWEFSPQTVCLPAHSLPLPEVSE